MKISTREYIDNQTAWTQKLIAEQKEWMLRYIDSRFAAVQEAVNQYRGTNDEWKQGANEFRGQLKDQAGTFLTRKELWLAILAVLGMAVAIVGLLLRK